MAISPSRKYKNVKSFRAKATRFMERVNALSPLTGSLLGAACLVFSMRFRPDRVHSVTYNGKVLVFRAVDEMALREVLVDNEYGFLRERLVGIAAPKVLDVGAHIGTFAIWLASVNERAALTCVEADPATVFLTRRNLAAHMPGANVLHRAGGGDDTSVLRFSVVGPSMSHRVDPSGKVEVCSISLGALIDAAAGVGGRVDLAKIDIEGSEEALLCSEPAALSRVEALVVELHPGLCDIVAVRAVLEQYFENIVEVGGRKSSKPLLYCQGNCVLKT